MDRLEQCRPDQIEPCRDPLSVAGLRSGTASVLVYLLYRLPFVGHWLQQRGAFSASHEAMHLDHAGCGPTMHPADSPVVVGKRRRKSGSGGWYGRCLGTGRRLTPTLGSSSASMPSKNKAGRKHKKSWERSKTMKAIKYAYWQDEDMWLGYLEEYPDYWTQGETIEELKENLRDIYRELTSGSIPYVRRVAELEVA